MSAVLVSTYTRRVHASLARVWENVLDWEHLPWLHRDTFASVHLLQRDHTGWRAEASVHGGQPFTIDLTIDRGAGCYHSRTIAGAGTGSDIVTRLTAVAPHATDVSVEFWIPDVPAAKRAAVGARYTALYTRLWDEDERMMQRRQALLDAPPQPTGRTQVVLGQAEAVRARTPFVIGTPAGRVRVVDDRGTLRSHPTTCPHLGGPLDAAPVVDGCVACPWHGYRFALHSGRSADEHVFSFDPATTITVAADGLVTLSVEQCGADHPG
jgi:nitrite reductase/ring-hydroxylating ferredoxin subunit